jgi:DNA-binding transcriptional regulator LsrR (DeoR family)
MLRTARKIVLASGGWEKAGAIQATQLLIDPHVLITDKQVAETLTA